MRLPNLKKCWKQRRLTVRRCRREVSCDVVASLGSRVYMFTQHGVVVCKMCPHDCSISHGWCEPSLLPSHPHTQTHWPPSFLVIELEQLAEALQSTKRELNDAKYTLHDAKTLVKCCLLLVMWTHVHCCRHTPHHTHTLV